MIKLATLKKNPKNPRLIKDGKFELLKQSLTEFPEMMELRPIVVDADNVILAGNMRWSALKALGKTEVPNSWVKRADKLTDEQRREFTIKDNNGFGEYDWDLLANEWDDCPLADWGVDVPDVEAVEPAGEADAEPQMDKAAELNKKWKVKPGDLWLIGEHRLLCGDSTKREDVERVMGGERPQVLFTSPPYWVGFEYEHEDKWSEVLSFISRFCDVHTQSVAGDGRIIINTGTVQAGQLTDGKAHMRLLIDTWAARLLESGWRMRYVRFWVKDGGLLHTAPGSDCIDQHTEFIGYFYNPSGKFRGQERTGEPWAGKGYWSDLQGAARQFGHVASFPLEFATRNIQLFTRQGEIVSEPFAGAGTTLVACENLHRICYALETSPAYCAVILDRMERAFPDIEIQREPLAKAA